MSRMTSVTNLSKLFSQIKMGRARLLAYSYSSMPNTTIYRQNKEQLIEFTNNHNVNNSTSQSQITESRIVPKRQIGQNVSRKDKITFLVSTLRDIQDSKEAVYSTLDAWVAWERDFPIGPLKNVLLALEKEQQWHRVIQVIKWMLSKGQGRTRGTYGQLIHALEKDNRVEEANEIWKEKLAFDLHSVPWKLCNLMISVYFRNNMFEDLVKLFKSLEAFDRKPPEKSILRKVADAYELLGLLDERERVLEKYKDLFAESSNKKTRRYNSPKKGKMNTKGVSMGSHGPL